MLNPSISVTYCSSVATCTLNFNCITPYMKQNCNHDSYWNTNIGCLIYFASSLTIFTYPPILLPITNTKYFLVLQQAESLQSDNDNDTG